MMPEIFFPEKLGMIFLRYVIDCRPQGDDDIGGYALGLNRGAIRGIVAGRGQAQTGPVVHGDDGLHRTLAKGLRP